MKHPVELNGKTILVTGSPGFIGANLVMRLLDELTSGTVISFDNMNDYYDPKLKEYRLGLIKPGFAIPSNIPKRISRAISSASTTFWRPAVTTLSSIWSMLLPLPSTVGIRRSPLAQTTWSIIPCHSMLPRKRATNYWHTAIRSSITFLRRVYVSSQYTDLQEGRICSIIPPQ